jgi:hypothetical protein
MRKKLLVISGLFALVGTIAVAAVLGTAGIGKAASPNICVTASTSTPTNASCVAELTAPHVLTAGEDAVSVTRFKNESGLGGASATHVVLSATFSASVTVKGVTLFVNGSPVSTASCSPAPLVNPVATVSCPVGTIAGGSSAKLVVRFSASTGMTVAGSASYGEGGNDTAPPRPNGTKNDLQISRDSFKIAGTEGAFGQGDCFDTVAPVSGSTSTQSTTATFSGAVDPSLDLPCTPAGAGVDTLGDRPTGFVSSIWFTDFLEISDGGFATVTLDALFNVPKSFVLKELTGTNPLAPASWTAVPACNASGLPPSGSDSCIFGTSNLPKGGFRWTLHALGVLFDSKYAG